MSSLGTGLTLPFLIVYLHSIRHVSLPVAGLLVAVSAVVGMAATAAGGPLGDRIGLGRMLVLGLSVQAVGTALLAIGGGVLEAAVAVSLIAAGGTSWPALNGLIAGQVPLADQPRAYALRFGVLNAGIGIGGLASGWIVALDNPASFQLVYGIDATSTALFAVLVVVGMRSAPGFRAVAHGPVRQADPGERPTHGYRAVLTDRAFVAYLACALALGVFGYAQLNGPWAAFATLIAHATPRIVGFAFAANTAAIVVSQLAVVRLTQRWRRSRLLALTAVFWAVAWVATGLAALPALRGLPADVMLVLSLAVFGLGETFLSPVNGAMPNVLAPPHLRARYNALASMTWPIGELIGPPLAGLLLGGPAPASWVLLITVGTALTAAGGLALARLLPASAERPPAEVPAT